jgi:7-cyano-7-deazaguanine synthase
MKKVVLSLSGGADSTTLLAYYLDKRFEPTLVHFQYGSKHNPMEEKSVHLIKKHYGIESFYSIDLPFFSHFKSNLLKGQGEIPEGHYQESNMSLTAVPGRNLIFASILIGIAESIGAEIVALGVHMGDHFIYADCRPRFINDLQCLTLGITDNRVKVQAPFLYKTKKDIISLGFDLKTPYHLTRTCYKEEEKACGKCGSCVERLEAFSLNGLEDPISYM